MRYRVTLVNGETFEVASGDSAGTRNSLEINDLGVLWNEQQLMMDGGIRNSKSTIIPWSAIVLFTQIY